MAIELSQLGAALRVGALVGCPAALLDPAARLALGLGGLVARAGRGARRAIGLVAGGVGLRDGGGGRLDLRQRGVLGLRGALDLGDQGVAAVALGEHAVLAAGGHLAQLARGRGPHAARLRDRDAGEVLGDRVERLDHPHVGEQHVRERVRRLVGVDAVQQPLGAGPGRTGGV